MASATGLESFSVEEDAIYSANFDAIDRIVRRQSSCADKAKDMHKLEGFQKVFAKQKMDLHTPDRGKGVLGRPDRNPEDFQDFQQKATKTHFPSRSLSPSCTFSAAVMLLRKRKSESHVIAHDVYHPHIKDCGEGKAKICASSISPTLKQGEDVRQGGFSFSYTSQSPAPDENMQKEGLSDVSDACLANSPFFLRQHAPEYETLYEPVLKPILHLGTESQPRRRSKSKSTLPYCSDLEKNKIASSTDAKKRTKEKLNWEDWHILKEAGTSWRSGVRRSTRIRSRPLEFWRGERFLYGRIHNCLSTIVGIKYISPEKAIPRKDSTAEFKVQSYVDDKYTDIVKFAALH